MLTKRIIPCLDVKNGRTVKGINFKELKDAGEPAELALTYMNEGADEIVFLDISASNERRKTMAQWVEKVAQRIFIPFTVGGGISSVEEAKSIISLGADKISLNTSAVKEPNLIKECSQLLGSQAVVLAVDVAFNGRKSHYEVFINGGTTPTGLEAISWIKRGVSLGCGEILLTSIDRDGTKDGYDLGLIAKASSSVNVPIIASGGAGKKEDFLEAISAGADAVLAASVFHYNQIKIKDLKKYLKSEKIPIREEECYGCRNSKN